MADVIIVGGGAAGLTAGVYTSRSGAEVVLLDRTLPGGMAATTDIVENYPGFPDAPSGPDLMEKFIEHAKKFGTKIETADAQGFTPGEALHTVHTSNGDYTAPVVILGCGADHRKLGIPGEEEYANKGVSYCATCDGPMFKDSNVLIVGGGDSAITGALFISRFAKKVSVIHRRDELRATQILQERAFAKPNIEIIWDTIPLEVHGEQVMTSLRVRNVKTEEESQLEGEGVFVLIGTIPNTDWLGDALEKDDGGYLIIDAMCRTSVDGVFAAGEVADPVFRQIVVAAGQGSMAAISAERYLQEVSS